MVRLWQESGHPQIGSLEENLADVPSAKGRGVRRVILRDSAVCWTRGLQSRGEEELPGMGMQRELGMGGCNPPACGEPGREYWGGNTPPTSLSFPHS